MSVESSTELEPHFFRHEYGKLVALLSRRIGVQHLELVEDGVQSALMSAAESWKTAGLPESPAAWLYRAACNAVTDELRKRARQQRILADTAELQAGVQTAPSQAEPAFDAEVQDDLLRLLFVCCDEQLPPESQLVLALKTLCGFDVREIALRLFITEANVYKRLNRARARLKEVPPTGLGTKSELAPEHYAARLSAVHKILYLLFTEGYLSSHSELAIRQELCDEAIRLGQLLAEHPVSQCAESSALLALMFLQSARLNARQDDAGALVLLQEQDRDSWDAERIQLGIAWLEASAVGEHPSRYHLEAAIAAEHCLAQSFEQTRWDKIVEYYELLEQVSPSPMHRLSRAVALAEWKGPAAALALLDAARGNRGNQGSGAWPPTWLEGSYHWAAVLADLHRRCGNTQLTSHYRELALDAAPSQAIRALLERRLQIPPSLSDTKTNKN